MTSICQQLESTIEYSSNCKNCKHAITFSNKHYCTKFKRHRKNPTSCPYFEAEPIEYKAYIRM